MLRLVRHHRRRPNPTGAIAQTASIEAGESAIEPNVVGLVRLDGPVRIALPDGAR